MGWKHFLKRTGAAALSLAMAAALCVPGFATSTQTTPSKDVTGSYNGSGAKVYSYGYSFGDMVFTYNAPSDQAWDPKTHSYTTGTASRGSWTFAPGANEITIVNHSNGAVNVRLSFDPALEGFKGGFTENNFTIDSAVGTQVDSAPKKTVQFGPANENTVVLTEGQTNVTLGTVTIHVTGA